MQLAKGKGAVAHFGVEGGQGRPDADCSMIQGPIDGTTAAYPVNFFQSFGRRLREHIALSHLNEQHQGIHCMSPATNGFLLSLSLCLDIGIVNIAMMTAAMQRGYWTGFWLGMGSCIGDLIYAILALAGMTALSQFSAVRWGMWLGGTVVLVVLAVKMGISAFRSVRCASHSEPEINGTHCQQLLKGALLALSSPSAIVWFAAVGGALIAQSAMQGWKSTGPFLAGFFVAGVAWTCALCLIARAGGKAFGTKALSFCYLASATLFVFFAWQVVSSGYRTLILGLPV
ncbi:LysE family translocator [Paraburkholderia sp. SOS3]|uniref:LysE family translocator n=1 Tax=Paraburkholderia sp. SOS3 TaxID=1926494 RepID=UPI002FBEC79B